MALRDGEILDRLPTPSDLSSVVNGARIANTLPYINAEIDAMKRTLMTRMFAKIRQGVLTPEAAYEGWMELFSYERLTKRFEKTVQAGVNAGRKLETGDDTNG